MNLYLEEAAPQASASEFGKLTRGEFRTRLSRAATLPIKTFTLHNSDEAPYGSFLGIYEDADDYQVFRYSLKDQGLRGFGIARSLGIETRVDPMGEIEWMIPSDPVGDNQNYENPSVRPASKLGGQIKIPVTPDENHVGQFYGSKLVGDSLVVEMQGMNQSRPWVRRCVVSNPGETKEISIPVTPENFTKKNLGPFNMVVAREYRFLTPVPDEKKGDMLFILSTANILSGAIAP